MKSLFKAVRGFRDEDRGSLVVEAVMILPFLMWAYVGLYVYWDAFRSINTVQKAAYSVSDMISREMITITPAYLTGMDSIMERLIDQSQDASMRVTSVYCNGMGADRCDDLTGRNEVHWSLSPGSMMPALTTTSLQALEDHIPAMSDGDYVVIVEISVTYTPAFNFGLTENLNLQQFIVTRPRFVPRICMQGYACS